MCRTYSYSLLVFAIGWVGGWVQGVMHFWLSGQSDIARCCCCCCLQRHSWSQCTTRGVTTVAHRFQARTRARLHRFLVPGNRTSSYIYTRSSALASTSTQHPAGNTRKCSSSGMLAHCGCSHTGSRIDACICQFILGFKLNQNIATGACVFSALHMFCFLHLGLNPQQTKMPNYQPTSISLQLQ